MALSYEAKDGKIQLKYDKDQDGEPSVDLSIHINEAIQEAFDRGDEVEGVKLAKLSFEGMKLKLEIDTDQDGEKVMELLLDIPEGLDESGVLK